MSRYAVISDIHGNLFAFEAVLRAMSSLSVDGVICLGDTVGYGPHPGECLDLVVKHCDIVVQGNHDEAVVDPDCADRFNGAAREAIYWTREVLGPLHLNALLQMPIERRLGLDESSDDRLLCIHDSPGQGPTNYVHDKLVAAIAFKGLAERSADVCLIGHTHVPMVFETPRVDADTALKAQDLIAYIPSHEVRIELRPDHRYICNPGSVGQPRDCDARASFAVLDLDDRTFCVHRVEYDIAGAQAAAQSAGLPMVLADRLAIGA